MENDFVIFNLFNRLFNRKKKTLREAIRILKTNLNLA